MLSNWIFPGFTKRQQSAKSSIQLVNYTITVIDTKRVFSASNMISGVMNNEKISTERHLL